MSRPTANNRSDYRAFSTITTRWFDNDIYGHMNNALHYQLFDTAVNGHLLREGALFLDGTGPMFLVVETGCTYFAEMAFPDVITAGIRVAHLGGSSVRYEVGLFKNDEQTASAQGHFVHVNVNRDTRKPAPMDGDVRKVLERLV